MSACLSSTVRFTVAIDLAKQHHVATIFDAKLLKPCEVVRISVTALGFEHFKARLDHYSGNVTDFIIGCEATGHYGETLLKWLQHRGYNIGVTTSGLQHHSAQSSTGRAIPSGLRCARQNG